MMGLNDLSDKSDTRRFVSNLDAGLKMVRLANYADRRPRAIKIQRLQRRGLATGDYENEHGSSEFEELYHHVALTSERPQIVSNVHSHDRCSLGGPPQSCHCATSVHGV